MKRPIICLAVLSLLSAVSGKAPDFAPVFNSGMVLQQGRELTICGKAEPGEELSLEFAGQKVAGKAGKDGSWRLKLTPLSISHTPQTMTITGPGGIRKLNDILVGEVWLCSGQSNMYWPLNLSLNGKETAAASNYPEVRVFGNYNKMADSPQDKTSAIWGKLNPNRAATMSAVAFYFGRKLYQELKIPIGLICAYRGGTMIEPWTPAGAWDEYPDLKKRIYTQFSKTPDKTSKKPKDWPQNQPHVLYNGAIHPLTPCAFRGVIWYQGCSNVWYDSQEDYLLKQQALFDGWKKAFSNPEMKFYTVQIAPLKREETAARNHVGIWLAQQRFADANDPQVKLVIINDVGDLNNIHPTNKEPVGIRLANLALKYDYAKNISADFPCCKTIALKNGAAHLSFSSANGWKTTDNGPVRNFEIAGPDGNFVPALARILGAKIIVSAPEISALAAVRYMYNSSTLGNLVNEAGLPLGSFETNLNRRINE